jgi:DNA polymerase III delta subunit
VAAPNPDDELTRLSKLAARPLPPLVAVTGVNDMFRAEAVDRLLAAVPPAAELRVLDAGDEREAAGGGGDGGADAPDDADGDGDAGGGSDADVAACPELADLRGGGLFAKVAFLVVRRGGGWWQRHVAAVAASLPRFGKGCTLIVEAPKLDRRKKVAQALVKSLADSGALFEFRELYDSPFDRTRSPLESELCKWVVARAARLGVPLQADAAWLVVMQVGKQPADLVAELGRLRDRFGADPKRKPLAPADLRGALTVSFQSTPFELADAVLKNDRRAATRSLRAMFDRSVRTKDGKAMDTGGVFPFATNWLHGQIATALDGRQLLASGVSERDLPARAGVRGFADRFVEQVRNNDEARLRRGIRALVAVQRLSRLTGEEPDALLERFLAAWFDGVPVPVAEDLEP